MILCGPTAELVTNARCIYIFGLSAHNRLGKSERKHVHENNEMVEAHGKFRVLIKLWLDGAKWLENHDMRRHPTPQNYSAVREGGRAQRWRGFGCGAEH